MKQTKRIIVAGIVLILLIVSAIVVIKLLPRDDENNIVSPKWLVETKGENVAKLEVTNENGSYTATFGEGGAPAVEGYEPYALNAEITDAMQSGCVKVYAYDTIDRSGEKLSEYGMDSPVATAKITASDGTETKITVGAMMPSKDAYYVMTDAGDNVYGVKKDYLYYFLINKLSFISKQMTTIETDTAYLVDYITITTDGQPYLSIAAMSDNEKEHYNSDGLFKMSYPYSALGRDVNIVSYLNTVCNFKATAVKSLDVGAESLAENGLDTPASVVEYQYNKGTPVRILLSPVENGFCNAMVEGGNVIYSVLAQRFGLISFDALDYVNVNQFKRDINDVSRIILRANGTSSTYDVSVSNSVTTAKLGSTALDAASFEQFYSLITTSSIIGAAEKPAGEPYMTMVFRYTDGTKMPNDTVNFYKINDREYFIEINGSGNFYVSSLFIDKVLECSAKLNAGEEFSIAY